MPKLLKVFIENGPPLSPEEKWKMFINSLHPKLFETGLNQIEKLLPVYPSSKFAALKGSATYTHDSKGIGKNSQSLMPEPKKIKKKTVLKKVVTFSPIVHVYEYSPG